jgi:hypothetical protein
MTTQPLDWTPPSTAKTYILQPLQQEQIEEFLVSRPLPDAKSTSPEDQDKKYKEYQDKCKTYLSFVLNEQDSKEREAIDRMLSNPMELTIISEMLARKKEPDLFNLQQQQYNMMKEEYKRINLQDFPLENFSEAVYQMRLNDQN